MLGGCLKAGVKLVRGKYRTISMSPIKNLMKNFLAETATLCIHPAYATATPLHQLFRKMPSQTHFHRNDLVQPTRSSRRPAPRMSARISETGIP